VLCRRAKAATLAGSASAQARTRSNGVCGRSHWRRTRLPTRVFLTSPFGGHTRCRDGAARVVRSVREADGSPRRHPLGSPRGIRAGPESTHNRVAIPRVLPCCWHITRERHRVVRCQVGSRFVVQAAEQTAHPSAVRAGGRVLAQIAVLKSVNSPISAQEPRHPTDHPRSPDGTPRPWRTRCACARRLLLRPPPGRIRHWCTV